MLFNGRASRSSGQHTCVIRAVPASDLGPPNRLFSLRVLMIFLCPMRYTQMLGWYITLRHHRFLPDPFTIESYSILGITPRNLMQQTHLKTDRVF
jgi:hypothetical protein